MDAFTVNWNKGINVYVFPSFSQIQKAILQAGGGPSRWTVHPPKLANSCLLSSNDAAFDSKTDLDTEGERTLQLMYSDSDHLLHPRLQLLAVTLSGKPSKHKDFMDELRRSSKTLGDNLLNANIYRTLRDGKCPVLETNVHLSITYLPGKLNAEADEQSKKFNEQTEWKLNPKVKKKKKMVQRVSLSTSCRRCAGIFD